MRRFQVDLVVVNMGLSTGGFRRLSFVCHCDSLARRNRPAYEVGDDTTFQVGSNIGGSGDRWH